MAVQEGHNYQFYGSSIRWYCRWHSHLHQRLELKKYCIHVIFLKKDKGFQHLLFTVHAYEHHFPEHHPPMMHQSITMTAILIFSCCWEDMCWWNLIWIWGISSIKITSRLVYNNNIIRDVIMIIFCIPGIRVMYIYCICVISFSIFQLYLSSLYFIVTYYLKYHCGSCRHLSNCLLFP